MLLLLSFPDSTSPASCCYTSLIILEAKLEKVLYIHIYMKACGFVPLYWTCQTTPATLPAEASGVFWAPSLLGLAAALEQWALPPPWNASCMECWSSPYLANSLSWSPFLVPPLLLNLLMSWNSVIRFSFLWPNLIPLKISSALVALNTICTPTTPELVGTTSPFSEFLNLTDLSNSKHPRPNWSALSNGHPQALLLRVSHTTPPAAALACRFLFPNWLLALLGYTGSLCYPSNAQVCPHIWEPRMPTSREWLS